MNLARSPRLFGHSQSRCSEQSQGAEHAQNKNATNHGAASRFSLQRHPSSIRHAVRKKGGIQDTERKSITKPLEGQGLALTRM